PSRRATSRGRIAANSFTGSDTFCKGALEVTWRRGRGPVVGGKARTRLAHRLASPTQENVVALIMRRMLVHCFARRTTRELGPQFHVGGPRTLHSDHSLCTPLI